MACQLSNGTALCSAHADGGQNTLPFRHHHCYDYRAAYLNPHMIHKTLKNKTLKVIKKGIRTDHPASHYGLLDLHPEDDKTAHSGEFYQNK